MNLTDIADAWDAYARRPIDETIHPDDRMFSDRAHYLDVGRTAMRVIASALALAPVASVRRVLDFGSGHGRVGRHLRAFFPDATLCFCDTVGAEWAASQFGGEVASSSTEFDGLSLPGEQDLIWVGSVFTHLPKHRAYQLMARLAAALAVDGVLVLTQHGRRARNLAHYETARRHPARWQAIVDGFVHEGYGYSDSPGQTGWGLALVDLQQGTALATSVAGTRLIWAAEAAWRNHHDVYAVARQSLA